MSTTNITLIVLGVIVLILVLMYNNLIRRKNQVENIFASIDALLKKRYDLIPNLVAAVRKYMAYERELLDRLTKLRTRAISPDISDDEKMQLDREISGMLGSLMVAVENYPELKANENVLHLQQTLAEIEEQISAARRAYNQAVTDYNNTIEMIPTNIMANMMGYRRKKVFSIDENERRNFDIQELFINENAHGDN